jgi:UDP-N-acetylmuramoyl-L-alanyl-D-glutamate--2,6-diaminopimelate ligase
MALIIPLNNLIKDFSSIGVDPDCCIEAMTHDSRLVQPGTLFVAIPGLKQDGRHYISKALSQGARAVLYDTKGGFIPAKELQTSAIPLIGIDQLNEKLGLIASRFYQHPSQNMTVIGVTGTNGKTSISQFIAQALNRQHQNCAVIGTLGKGFLPYLEATGFTTPDPINLQKDLAHYSSQGARYVSMEVSSHSLEQKRVAGIKFDTAIFTNLTRDHLDYHQTMKQYGAAKARLFQLAELKNCIYNADDAFGLELLSQHPSWANRLIYSTNPNLKQDSPSVIAKEIRATKEGFQIKVCTPWGEAQIQSCLLGQFNISNLLAVLCVLGTLDFSLAEIVKALEELQPVAGRMQAFGGSLGKPLVIVDYAHTPDALKQVLSALREHHPRKLWSVFGCGGDRDRGKRPQMGAISAEYADCSVLTNDNPRSENPETIIQEIRAGISLAHPVKIELDRAAAIAYAIQHAGPDDIVLIAGKGHETEQIIGKTILPFSDATSVQNFLKT